VESPHRGTVRTVGDDGNGSLQSPIVWQAQGMISVQVPCTVEEALLLLGARARTNDLDIEVIAAGVVGGLIRFD
jgi:hypothetical protein